MGNIIRVENVRSEKQVSLIPGVQSIDPEINNTGRYVHLYSTPDMMEHLTSKPYYGLKCQKYRKNILMCKYSSIFTDSFYDTDIFLVSSPEKIEEIVFDIGHRLQCVPDEFGMLCLST